MSDEMYNLLAKYFSGQATTEEQLTVKNWTNASKENRNEFETAKRLWQEADNAETLTYDTEAAWQKVKTFIDQSPVQHKGRVIKMFTKRMVAAVAAAVLLFVAGYWWLNQNSNKYTTITAGTAIKEVVLEDGSHVYLRKDGKLTYPKKFSGNKRDVELDGEAFFDIAKDPEKPFEIKAAATSVTVLGTSFTVNTGNSQVEVVVKTGLVKFSSLNDTTQNAKLSPGERAVFRNNKLVKGINTNENYNSWQTGVLTFRNTPMQEVIKALSSHYSVSFVIKKGDESKVQSSAVTSTFIRQPLEEVIKEIELITTFHIRKVNNTAYEISSE